MTRRRVPTSPRVPPALASKSHGIFVARIKRKMQSRGGIGVRTADACESLRTVATILSVETKRGCQAPSEKRELGYVGGQNIALEVRSAEGKTDQLPALASELAALKVDVIVTAATPAIQAAKQATRTIPIVTISADPVATGLVASLSRPGGNITGLSVAGPEMSGKQVQLVKETHCRRSSARRSFGIRPIRRWR